MSPTPRVLELGTFLVPAYAGMVLAEQGIQVAKWVSPVRKDPIQELRRGDEMWSWLNEKKSLDQRHASDVNELKPGEVDAVIDNFRPSAWAKWGIDPAIEAKRLEVVWVSMRDDFEERSFDAIAQARAWGDHIGLIPIFIGDTAGGLWVSFKVLAMLNLGAAGHYVLRQAACLVKLVEGELVVDVARDGVTSPWDEPDVYGRLGAGARVLFRGDSVEEPFRDQTWRRTHLDHTNGRINI